MPRDDTWIWLVCLSVIERIKPPRQQKSTATNAARQKQRCYVYFPVAMLKVGRLSTWKRKVLKSMSYHLLQGYFYFLSTTQTRTETNKLTAATLQCAHSEPQKIIPSRLRPVTPNCRRVIHLFLL